MTEPKEKLSYLYKEYDRLHGVVNAYSQSSFDDFKLLGALGLVFAWDPIVSVIKAPKATSEADMLLLGFVVTLVLSAIIAVRDLLKQSLLAYNHDQLKAYERQLRQLLEQEDKGTFRGTENWNQWFQTSHRYVALSFYWLYSFAIVTFSTIILFWRTTYIYALSYLLIAAVVSIFPGMAIRSLYKRFALPPNIPSAT